jgi:hypothetical protein
MRARGTTLRRQGPVVGGRALGVGGSPWRWEAGWTVSEAWGERHRPGHRVWNRGDRWHLLPARLPADAKAEQLISSPQQPVPASLRLQRSRLGLGRQCMVSCAGRRGGMNRLFSPQPRRTRSGSYVLDEPTGPLGGRLLAKSLGQLTDLGFWVAAVAAQGLQEGQLAFLGQRDTVLGETCRTSATSAVWRYLG